MLQVKEYVKVKSVDEAYELLQKNRKNRIIGGMLWLRLSDGVIPTGIDLSDCGLGQIEENGEEVKIGAMVTLREMETSPVTAGLYNGILGKCVADIVGVQFRNLATVGGSIYSRFGFSDVLTAMLCLPVDVVLYHGGRITLQEFVNKPYERDVLTHIIVKKEAGCAHYLTERRSATDLPVLAVGVSKIGGEWKISIGARPARAKLLTVAAAETLVNAGTGGEAESFAGADKFDAELMEVKRQIREECIFGSNMRGSKEYRELLAVTFAERAMKAIEEGCSC